MGCSALVQPRHRAYQEVNDRVLTEMATALTGNTDVTFMPGMTSRHQGVIDTARVVCQRGRGPKVRKLASSSSLAKNGRFR